MRDRIRGVVDDALGSADADMYDRWQQAKNDIEDAYIHTIHGFCSRILKEYVVGAGVHPDFETLDNGDAETLIERSVRDVLAYVLDESMPLHTTDAIDPTKHHSQTTLNASHACTTRDKLASLLGGLLNELKATTGLTNFSRRATRSRLRSLRTGLSTLSRRRQHASLPTSGL